MKNIDNVEAYEITIRLWMSTKQTYKHNTYEMSNHKTTNHTSANWNRYSPTAWLSCFPRIIVPWLLVRPGLPLSLQSRHFQIWIHRRLWRCSLPLTRKMQDDHPCHNNLFLHLSKIICPLLLLSAGMGDVFTFLIKDLVILNSFQSKKKGILK